MNDSVGSVFLSFICFIDLTDACLYVIRMRISMISVTPFKMNINSDTAFFVECLNVWN